ncbi:hypothetical protein [Chryseobacterium populi]|uniref:hypothetical protein n=1 Tax=Chryseobacterium populi TaxID=1144316 RepID=UPI00373FD1F1
MPLPGPGLADQLKFIEATHHFHESKRLFFYPKIFTNEPVKKINWKKFPLEYYHRQYTLNWWTMLGPLLLFSISFGLLKQH